MKPPKNNRAGLTVGYLAVLILVAVGQYHTAQAAPPLSVLEVLPEQGLDATGPPAGPFTPISIDYQLTNTAPTAIYWGGEVVATWVELEPDWGRLEPCDVIIVTLSLTAAAETLDEGLYTDTLIFTDITSQQQGTRPISLEIAGPGGIWLTPQSYDFEITEGTERTEYLTIGNDGETDLNFIIHTHTVNGTQSQQTSGGIIPVEPQPIPAAIAEGIEYKPGELIVRFATAAGGQQCSSSQKMQIVSSLGGGTILQNYDIVDGLCLVELTENVSVEDAIGSYNNDAGVLYAQPNYRVSAAAAVFPNDPRFDDLWGLHNISQTGGVFDADIDAPEAWEIATGTSQIIVAVLDTGVDYNHPDLAANMWVNQTERDGTDGVDDDDNGYVDDIYGYDFCNGDGDPADDHHHGTHCAGTIGAIGNNGEGIAGVCWDVRIMALKFLDSSANGWTDDAILCIQYSTLMGAKILNNSWGGGGYNQGLKDAIDTAAAYGTLFIAAAGNTSNNNDAESYYPSSYDCPNIISVLATDKYDNLAGFSNYGHSSVDLGAPGADILSCDIGGGYRYLGGTSMAAPHVAGAAAIVWSTDPRLPYAQVKDMILESVDNTLPGVCLTEGRLNLYDLALKAKAPWIDVEPEEQWLQPDTFVDVMLRFKAGQLTPGAYQAEITVNSNDPYNPVVTVPVAMTVLPDDLYLGPDDGLAAAGTEGGPFAPNCKVYTLENNGEADVNWTTAATADWLDITPADGILGPNEVIAINVCLTAQADILEPNVYMETLVLQNVDSGSTKLRQVTLTVIPHDSFTEAFEEQDNDLAYNMITLAPDGSAAYYTACRQSASEFATDPTGGTYISLWDDDFAEIAPTGGAIVPFYGQIYDRLYVGSNGYVTFSAGDTEFLGTFENHFDVPRISAIFTDLAPGNDQCISWKQTADRLAITFEGVPLFGDKDTANSFQIELFFDETVRLTYHELDATDGLAGLSDGFGRPSLFVQSDLSRYVNCLPLGDCNGDYAVTLADYAIMGAHWLDTDCENPFWCDGADTDLTGQVDQLDLQGLTQNWLID